MEKYQKKEQKKEGKTLKNFFSPIFLRQRRESLRKMHSLTLLLFFFGGFSVDNQIIPYLFLCFYFCLSIFIPSNLAGTLM